MTVDDALRQIIRHELREALAELRVLPDPAPGRSEPDGHEYVTVAAAARIASVSVGCVRLWLREQRLRRYGSGRTVRIKVIELHEFLRRGDQRAGPTPRTIDEEAASILRRRS